MARRQYSCTMNGWVGQESVMSLTFASGCRNWTAKPAKPGMMTHVLTARRFNFACLDSVNTASSQCLSSLFVYAPLVVCLHTVLLPSSLHCFSQTTCLLIALPCPPLQLNLTPIHDYHVHLGINNNIAPPLLDQLHPVNRRTAPLHRPTDLTVDPRCPTAQSPISLVRTHNPHLSS